MTEMGDGIDDFGEVITSLNIFRKASEVDNFRNWLRSRDGPREEVFEGYKFFLRTGFRTIMQSLIYSSLAVRWSDFTFFRARFEGVELSKIPNTSKMTTLIKSVNEYRREVRKAETWEEVQAVLTDFSEEVIDPFFQIYSDKAIPVQELGLNKEEVLRYGTILKLFTRFNDLDGGLPNGYQLTILGPGIWEEQFESSLTGYSYTLEFVWSNLLDEDTFEETAVSNLHDSDTWFDTADIAVEEEEVDPAHEMLSDLPLTDDRRDLDRFFGDISNQLIEPIEEELGISPFVDLFEVDSEFPQEPVAHLFDIDKEPDLNPKEEFQRLLLWYQVEFLEASSIFNGVSAFLSLLSGRVRMNQRFADGDDTLVCKFTHPTELGNDFTYGVLVEAWGTTGLADYSGWVMFYDCCGDYSGFAGSEHLQAENLIEEYQEKGLIELREMEVPKEDFEKWVASLSVGETGESLEQEKKLESQNNQLARRIRQNRGLTVEFLAYYILSQEYGARADVDWSVPLPTGEMDVVVEWENKVRLVECKIDPSNLNINEEISKMEAKQQTEKYEKPIEGEFWFWKEPQQRTKEMLLDAGFDWKLLSQYVEESQRFHGKELQNLRFALRQIEME